MAGKSGVHIDKFRGLQSAKFAFGGMNFLIDPADIDLADGVCTDICNCDVDYKQNASRRSGYTQVASGNITASWSNGKKAYVILDGAICLFDRISIIPLASSPVMANTADFVEVNNVVVCSDNNSIVCIDGTTCYSLSGTTEWYDAEQHEEWITANFPNDPAKWDKLNSNSNFETDAFSLPTLSGNNLEFHNGVLYVAKDNFVYCTKVFDIAHMDIRSNVVAGFSDNVTMIQRVSDGLFIGTEKECYFLQGTGYNSDDNGLLTPNFKQIKISSYGAVFGSHVRINGTLIPALNTDEPAILWTTQIGVFAGTNSGKYVNLSDKQITINTNPTAAAMFRDNNGIYQYIVSFIDLSTVLDESLLDTWFITEDNFIITLE